MNPVIDEPDLLTEVPPILKRLARVIIKAFYETEHAATINLLVKHTCVKEDDMFELLKFDKKQLRTVLTRLKNDKLIKQRVFKEKQADTGNMLTFNYYFIDYKLFVNVVKYKLDHIRNKIEHDEREATNRPSFVCNQCNKRYSDLEIDRLIDPTTGNLNCNFCNGPIEEDLTDVEQKQNSRSLLALFNDQMESVFALLKGCENIKLAPEVLEPSASLCMKQIIQKPTSGGSSSKTGWNNKMTSENLYKQDIQVNMGNEAINKEIKTMKETPLWIEQSTVAPVNDNAKKISSNDVVPTTTTATTANTADHDIMKHLLAHETLAKKPKLDTSGGASSDESDVEFSNVIETPGCEPVNTSKVVEEDSEGDEEITVKIGDKEIPLDDITDEMIEKMTSEEHDAYMKAYQEAFSHLY